MNKTVMIYGAGQCGKMIYSYLKREVNMLGYVDINAKEMDGIKDGVPVIHPATALENKPDLFIIAVNNVEQNALLIKKLKRNGISKERILSVRSIKEFLDLRFSATRLIASEIKSRHIHGAVAELGVYQGEFAALINELFPDRRLYLFDTFNGFSEKDVLKETAEGFSTARVGDFSDTSIEHVKQKLDFPDQAVFVKGYFPNSAMGINEPFAFVSIDADLFNPVYEGLKYFYPRMNQGGYILIHDYNNNQFKGAGNAVRQYCRENGLYVVPLSDVHGSAVLVKG